MTSTAKWEKRKSAPPRNLLRACMLFIVLYEVFAAESGDVCTNPDGIQGTCIGIRSCPQLLSAVQAKPLPQTTVDFLRKSQCGFQDRQPLVCCTPQNPSILRPEEERDDVSRHRNLGLLRSVICGSVSEPRFNYGSTVLIGLRPWNVLLSYTSKSGLEFRCGGSVINDRYVLTAAHCVTRIPSDLSLVSVRLGEHDLSTAIDCDMVGEPLDFCSPPPQDIPVDRVIPHPSFVGRPNYEDDIALIRLSSPANFTDDAVMPICLPITLEDRTANLVNKSIEMSGWGISTHPTGQQSSVIKRSTMRVIPHDRCSTEYRNKITISEITQICVVSLSSERDLCPKDSGGPLISLKPYQGRVRYVQQGIFSFGPPGDCYQTERPDVYTRVGEYMKWILDNIEP